MANRYAIVGNGEVENVILWNGDVSAWQPPEGMLAIPLPDDSPVAPGFSYDGAKFISPPPVVFE